MMRVACVHVRDAPLAALARRDPSLRDRAVAVVDTRAAHGRVVACTPQARTLGVARGQTVHQARAVAPAAEQCVVDAGAMDAMRAALADAAASVAARIEPAGDRVYLDAAELRRLHPTEGGLVAALTEAARRVGLEVDVGVAANKGVARIASSRRVGGALVPTGGERAFLAPWPLDVLPLDISLRNELHRLGVRTVGALAKLPLEAAGTRLGLDAAQAIALARGEDDAPFFARPHATRFEEAIELDWEVNDVHALVFVVKRLIDALIARLACRAMAASGVSLQLRLASHARDERSLALRAPTRDAATLVHLVRAALEGRAPADAVVGATLRAVAAPPRPEQLGLFDPPRPAPEAAALTLARLVALVGEGRVGAPVVPDTHRPHAVGIEPFGTAPPPRRASTLEAPRVALHVYRPPRPAEVSLEGGRIVHVRAGTIAGRVRAYDGPFRVVGAWWNEPFDHDAWDVVLGDDDGLYLVGLDRRARAWRLEGVYE